MNRSTPGLQSITSSRSLLKLMSIESVMASKCLSLSPLLLLRSFFPSIRVFSNESLLCIRWPKYWSFSFSISPSNEYSGLISFRMDWLGLLAVQGTLKSLLQHYSSKASILWHSAFFIVHLSHPYTTIGKTIALTRWTFVGKVMSLVFIGHNFSSEEQAPFNFMAAVAICSDFGAPQIKSVTVSTVFREVKGSWKKWYLEFSVSISHQDTKGSCCYCCLLVKSCPTLVTPWTVACQGPPSMGLTRQEYWRGLPFLSPGHLPSPEIELASPALAGRDSLSLSHGGSLQKVRNYLNTEMRSVCWTKNVK